MPVFGTRRSGPYYSGLTRWATRNCKPKQFQTKSKNEFIAQAPYGGFLVNGDFIYGEAYWTRFSAGSSINVLPIPGGIEINTGDPYAGLAQGFSTVIGNHYRAEGTISNIVSSAVFFGIRKSDDVPAATNVVEIISNGTGTAAVDFVATATTTYIILQVNGGGTIDFANISVTPLRAVVAAGTYTLSGFDTAAKISMPASAGSYVLTGSNATLAIAMPATAGSYALNGQAVTLKISMSGAAGSYVLTGNAATLALAMQGVAGSYLLTGRAATPFVGRRLSASAGFYAMTGNAAGLSKGVALAGASGSYVLSGSNASMFASHYLVASPSAYTLTGRPAALSLLHNMTAESGIYTFYGLPVTLTLVRTVLFHDNAPASTGIESAPAPQTVEVTPVASVGGSTLFALADAIPPPAAFVLQAAIPAAELEE